VDLYAEWTLRRVFSWAPRVQARSLAEQAFGWQEREGMLTALQRGVTAGRPARERMPSTESGDLR